MDTSNIVIDGREPCRRLDFGNEEDIDINNEVALFQTRNDDISEQSDEKSDRDSYYDKEIHAHVPKELIPKMDMEFENEKAAHKFYEAYAKSVGFGVRIWKAHRDGNKVVLDRPFCCSREGERLPDVRDGMVKKHRALTRCNCKAELKVSCRGTGIFRVVKFIGEHTHGVVTPSKTHLHRSFRRMTVAQRAEVDVVRSCGIAQRQTMELLAKEAGGREHLGFISDDCKNYLRSSRMIEMKVTDTRGVLEYLQRKQADDPNFLYAIDVDDDGLITNIFWADGRMRSDYHHFGDVVCFDTTYRKHKDGRPIALFVGVNNHKQTIIFGAVLLYDETISTFGWLFDVFAVTMSGKRPQTILTDQDAAMANTLADKWSDTCHRLCVWHIYQNAAIYLKDTFSKYKNFARDFSSCMYDHDEEYDFIKAWNQMLKDYHLETNKWLDGMFHIREKWALVYGRDHFCANMSSTQRSESMNKVIKDYISCKYDLSEFFHHFERLLNDRRYKELRADFHTDQSTPSISFPVPILNHAASLYTHEIYELFQGEVGRSYTCSIEILGESGTITEYNVVFFGSSHSHRVIYDSKDGSVFCGCRKYQFVGILCSHALKVINEKRLLMIPDQYIKRRWTKSAKKGNMNVQFQDMSHVDPKEVMNCCSRELSQLTRHLVAKGGESKKKYAIAKEGLLKLLEQVDAVSDNTEVQEHMSGTSRQGLTVERFENSNLTGKVVRGIKNKDKITYKTSKRLKSGLEKATNKKKRKSVTKNQALPSQVQLNQVPELVSVAPATQLDNLYRVDEIRPFQALPSQDSWNYSFATPYFDANLYPKEVIWSKDRLWTP